MNINNFQSKLAMSDVKLFIFRKVIKNAKKPVKLVFKHMKILSSIVAKNVLKNIQMKLLKFINYTFKICYRIKVNLKN